jgi:hypothetical protein
MMMIVGTTSSMTEDVITRLVEVDDVICFIVPYPFFCPQKQDSQDEVVVGSG